MEQELYGGIELGGTKTICAIGNASGELITQTIIPTTTVEETFGAVFQFFDANNPVSTLGAGTFGPLNLDAKSSEFGYIYNTPKPGWSKVGIKNLLEDHFKIPVSVDLDVNCAALGEQYYGVAQDVSSSFVYMTLGTGIGGSLIIDKQLVHGILDLEMGHLRVPHEPFTGTFKGACPFHKDCFEGIASGYAIQQRYNQKPEDITAQEIWNLEAAYIASALNNIMMAIGPERIVLGGGLINHAGLIENIREEVAKDIDGYMDFPDLNNYIVKSSGNYNGVLGASKLSTLT